MPTFNYEAQDSATGRTVKGSVEAKNEAEARGKLKAKGQVPMSLTAKAEKSTRRKPGAGAAGPERKKMQMLFGSGVKNKDVTLFTRQFSTLIDAGLPMMRGLDIMEQMLKPGGLRNNVMDVRDEVEQGSSLSEAMGKCPKAFDTTYISMIRAGETAGLLGQIMNRLADFMEKSERLKSKIIAALIYPAAVMTIAGAILSLIIVFIVPKFKKMFDSMNTELPWMTLMLMNLGDIMIGYWYLLPGIPMLIVGIFMGIRSTKKGKYFLDLSSLYLPVFGTIIKKSNISRFCRTLGELSKAGVPILDALGILREGIGNAVVAEAIADIHASIREGESIADPMRRGRVFDLMVVNMVEVGEETGDLDKMLIKIADTYDNEVDTLVGGMMSLLEPFLIIGMGLAVGFIVVALFLPLVKLMEDMGS